MHNVRHVAAGFPAGGEIVVLLIFAAAFVCLLVGPVLNDVMQSSISGPATRAAPVIFVIGLGALLTGVVAGVGVLDVVGASMMAIVLLAGLMMHY
jgi:hypothetical protein